MTTRRERIINQARTAPWRVPGPNGVEGYRYFSSGAAAYRYAAEKDRIAQLETRIDDTDRWEVTYPPTDYYCQGCSRVYSRPATYDKCLTCGRVMRRTRWERG